ncbi:MAG: ABC transporter permease [Micrococcaceae bacterium]|nr:ABC transporter permease [Micrococcaceae bacterium]
MKRLISNEWLKLRREKTLWFALALHLAPVTMVIAASAMGVHQGPPEQRYFVLHNQSVFLAAIVPVIVTAVAFRVELSNRTWFEWLMLPQPRPRLLTAKVLNIGLIQLVFIALSTVTTVVFLLTVGAGGVLIARSIGSYLILQLGSMVVMSAAAVLLSLLLRNTLIVNIIGIAVSMITMVLMAADFSWAIPTSWTYRTGLAVLDHAAYSFPEWWNLLAGSAIWVLLSAGMLLASRALCRSPAVLNAAV